MQLLELLAPARTADIGIAAVDCGADAVYIAGPAFGARQAAGNDIGDIRRLCDYAHRFGVRIFVTANTVIYEAELPDVRRMVREVADAGADALIVQDPALVQLAPEGFPLHASTQCAIRTPQKARFLESLGFGRLVLERELSLDQVRAIRAAVGCELEFFVHGALCVCYSGQCYLSEHLSLRSANRGACIQACRSRYDLEDASGKVLVRNKALLSLKDYNLVDRLEDLAEAGVDSFKIEGRLKGMAYVQNVVRAYSEALDALVRKAPDRYRRASFGTVRGGFAPDLAKTFNRGYTQLYLDGRRGAWSSMEAPTSLGEAIGTVARLRPGDPMAVTVRPADPGLVLHNGDGFAFLDRKGEVVGFRGDVCEGMTIRGKRVEGLTEGMPLYRNVDAAFGRRLETERPVREIAVQVQVRMVPGRLQAGAVSEDGRRVDFSVPAPTAAAEHPERIPESVRTQLGKHTGPYAFTVASVEIDGEVPFLPASFLNGIRRSLSEALDRQPVRLLPLRRGMPSELPGPAQVTYRDNVANSLSRKLYRSRGAGTVEDAYELTHRPGAELMRTRYCIRHELGLCPRQHPGTNPAPLYLRNNGRRLRLTFDCPSCEMTVTAADG